VNKRLILLRHGNTGFEGRYIGARDIPLSSVGVTEILNLKSEFQSKQIDKIVASTMLRCRQTAELLFPDCAISCDEDLREVDFGRWDGLTFPEILEKDPGLVDNWAVWSPEFCFPEGESIGDFLRRVYDAGIRLTESSDKNILVIAHGGVIRAMICHFLKLEASDYLLFQVEKGKYATLDLFSEGAVLTGLNLGGR
jgi:alpha-ribazole phosphatase